MSEQASAFLGYQQRVNAWMIACFGAGIADDRVERSHRFLEEALELVQALACTESEALQLVAYVFGRPPGRPHQELGGVMVTVAALATAQRLDLSAAAEDELGRIWTKVSEIRAKQAAKPPHSPLPEQAAPSCEWAHGAETMREAAAKLLEQPGFVFAFETEGIRKDVIRRIRALPLPTPDGRRYRVTVREVRPCTKCHHDAEQKSTVDWGCDDVFCCPCSRSGGCTVAA